MTLKKNLSNKQGALKRSMLWQREKYLSEKNERELSRKAFKKYFLKISD